MNTNQTCFRYTANKTYNEMGDCGVLTILKVEDGTYSIAWSDRFCSSHTVSGLASYDEAIGYAKCLTGNGKLKAMR